MEQENKNIEDPKYDIGTLLAWVTVFLVVGICIGHISTQSYVPVRGYIEYDKLEFGEPIVQDKIILKDTIITTTERVTIVDKCVKKDTLITYKKSIPSPYIIVTTDKTNGGIKFFSANKEQFYNLKKGDDVEPWILEEITIPINCK